MIQLVFEFGCLISGLDSHEQKEVIKFINKAKTVLLLHFPITILFISLYCCYIICISGSLNI